MKKKSRKLVLCFLIVSFIFVTACGSTSVVTSNTTEAEEKTASVVPASNTPMPSRVSTPEPLTAVQSYTYVVNGISIFLGREGLTVEELSPEDIIRVGKLQFLINGRLQSVEEIMASFSQEDWDNIAKSGAGLLMVAGVSTNCWELFRALWWACARWASGAGWCTVPGDPFSSHPVPQVQGKNLSHQSVTDTLYDKCLSTHRVEYQPNGDVTVTEVMSQEDWEAQQEEGDLELDPDVEELLEDFPEVPDSDWDFDPDPDMIKTMVTIGAVVAVGYIIVQTGGMAAPAMVPVLMVIPY